MTWDTWAQRDMAQDPREDKLPRWAQAKLASMRMLVTEARSRADQAVQDTNPDEALAVIEHYAYRVGLKSDRVTFRPSKDADYLEGIEVVAIPGGIEIHGRSGPVFIYPNSSNVVRVKMGGDW